MTQHLGDFPINATVDFKWSTNDGAGASVTRATNGTVSVYIGNGTTQLTTGVTDTEDFDSLTGVHHCRIDLSSSGTYAAGSECQVVLSAATIDGETVNAVLASFSIERAGGVLALLKGTNSLAQIRTDIAGVQSDTNDIQTRIPAALVSGRMDSSVGAMAANVMTAAAAASDLTTELQTGLATAAALATAQADLDDIQTRLPAALVGGRMDASVGAMANNVITAAATASDFGAEVADAVWDEATSGHATSGTTGAALIAAGSAGDPWSTALPGAYGAGTAGNIIGNRLDAAISTRASATDLATVDTVADGIAATLGAAGAGLTAVPWNAAWDAEVQSECTDALNAYDPPTNAEMVARTLAAADYATATALAAVDAKTTNLPSDPADQSLIIAATNSLASAIATVDGNVDTILGQTGTSGVVVAAASKTGYRLSATGVDDILDEAVETGATLRESLRISNAALAGKASGLETTGVAFRNLADTKDVVTATVDGDGNRSAVTLDLT